MSAYIFTAALWACYATRMSRSIGARGSDLVVAFIVNFAFCPFCIAWAALDIPNDIVNDD